MVFYLKVNRDNSYVIPNLKHWLDAALWREDSLVYILCDNEALLDKILKEISLDIDRVSFLTSDRSNDDINEILNNVCGTEKWRKVGQAHLTTHFHADANKYDFFWNIDADDTFICLDPLRINEMFGLVEKYSLKQKIHLNGLDMWRSMSAYEKWPQGVNWSLGITFVDNRIDWKNIMLDHCHYPRELGRVYDGEKDSNLDWYFTYLKDQNIANIASFYVENLKFMHFKDYFFNFPHLSSFMHWKDGILEFPIWEHCFETRRRTKIPIARDVIRIDMGINEDEALVSLIASSEEIYIFYNELRDADLKLEKVMKVRNARFMKEKGVEQIVCWGTGSNFLKHYPLVKQAYELKYVCDNDSDKWGRDIVDGVKCISPNELGEMKNVFVLVTVENVAINYDIVHQLLNMGIENFDHFDNWLEIVEGVRG